jgi:leucyl aminopeptidase
MNIQLSKATSFSNSNNVVFFTSNSNKFDQSLLSADEIAFVKKEFLNKKKCAAVNQLSRFVFVQLIEKANKKPHDVKEFCRRQGALLCAMLNGAKAEQIVLANDDFKDELLSYAEGITLANYQFLKYKSEKENNTLKEVAIKSKKITTIEINKVGNICDAVCRARDLVNEPQSYLNAPQLAKEFEALGKEAGFKVTVFDKKKIESLKMGGLLAVNMGSKIPPTFTIMEYKHTRAKNKKPYVLVGKGVVYDTGGLSLKPTANSMDYMKCDMGGSAAVACAMYAIAKQKLPLHVIALVPATDNRPGEDAYTPGDVITMHSGKTVEVLNTDAEGRMILADALHFAKQYNPELVMEFSTLTGAASAATGKYASAFMTTANDVQKKKIFDSSWNVFERMVEFPMWEDYGELIKSDIADIKNIGGPSAGMVTAAKFLEHFIDYPYMHFDIAGTAFLHTADSYRGKNGTGTGVRLIVDFLSNKVK